MKLLFFILQLAAQKYILIIESDIQNVKHSYNSSFFIDLFIQQIVRSGG